VHACLRTVPWRTRHGTSRIASSSFFFFFFFLSYYETIRTKYCLFVLEAVSRSSFCRSPSDASLLSAYRLGIYMVSFSPPALRCRGAAAHVSFHLSVPVVLFRVISSMLRMPERISFLQLFVTCNASLKMQAIADRSQLDSRSIENLDTRFHGGEVSLSEIAQSSSTDEDSVIAIINATS